MTNFLQMPNKLFSKKKRQINKSKQKVNIEEISSKKATISSLKSSSKKELLVPILATKTTKPKAKNIYIAMISMNVYCIVCHLKKAQIFTVLMRDIQYQAEKKARAEINPKSVVFQEYYNFLDIFSKKDSDTFSLHQKYNHKII